MPDLRTERIDEAVAFRRKTREHRVSRVNARWRDRARRLPSLHFSITDEQGDVYQLRLQTADMVWWVETVTLEG